MRKSLVVSIISLIFIIIGTVIIGISIKLSRDYITKHDYIETSDAIPFSLQLMPGQYEIYFPNRFKIVTTHDPLPPNSMDYFTNARLQIVNSQGEMIYSCPTFAYFGTPTSVSVTIRDVSNFTFVAPELDEYTISLNSWLQQNTPVIVYELVTKLEKQNRVDFNLTLVGFGVISAGVLSAALALAIRKRSD